MCRLAECLSLAREYRRLWQFISIYFFAEYCVNLVFPTQRSRPGANRRNNIIDFFFLIFYYWYANHHRQKLPFGNSIKKCNVVT